DAETFLRDWRALKEKDPAALGPAPPGQVAAWHGEEAEASALGKNWAATLRHLGGRIAADPDPPWYAFERRATFRERLGVWDGAAADLDEVLKRKTEDAELWRRGGAVQARRGKWQEAADDLARAAAFPDAEAAVRYDRAVLALYLEDREAYRTVA